MKNLNIIIFIFLFSLPVKGIEYYTIFVEDSCVLKNSHSLCLQQMGKYETGHNQGSHIKEYMDYVNLSYKKHYAYCMAMQSWCFQDRIPFKRTASTQGFYDYCKKNGTKTKPKFGKHSIIIWKKKGKYRGHVGRIDERIKKQSVYSLEGNTSPNKGDPRDGDGNYKKVRHLNHIISNMYVRAIINFEIK